MFYSDAAATTSLRWRSAATPPTPLVRLPLRGRAYAATTPDAGEPIADTAEPDAIAEADASAPDAGEPSEPDAGTPLELCPAALVISSGARHTCATELDHSLWCWGDDEYGQLGTGTTIDEPLPIQIDQDWIQVSSGRPMTG